MAATARFIHAADIHLGAAIRGTCNVDSEWAARLQRAIPEAYERVIDAAIEREVDFVVLAGDTFDTAKPSYGDYLLFFAGLERLNAAGIATYIVAGNNDPYTVWARDLDRLPESAHLLGADGPDFVLHRRAGEPLCLVGGRSYRNQAWLQSEEVSAGITRADAERALAATEPDAALAPFSVGLIHTGIDTGDAMAPCEKSSLMRAGIDYWACGHLHDQFVDRGHSGSCIAFPGCVQGRDMKETGERGCFLVELEQAAPGKRAQARIEVVPTSSVVLQQLAIDVSACQTLADVVRLVQASLFHENGLVRCDEMVARIALTGRTDLHGYLARDEVVSDLRNHVNNAYPSFFCDMLVDCTKPSAEADRLRAEGMFPQVVQGIAAEQRQREDVLIHYAQSELVKRGIAVPDSLTKQIGHFNERAESIIADLLAEEAE